jgi:NodT family efflux transporter outer membrane factor (OMF) lipoprotein
MNRLSSKPSHENHWRKTSLLDLALLGILGMVVIPSCSCALRKPPQHSKIVDQALPKATPLPPNWSATSDRGSVSDNWVQSFHDPGMERIVSEAIANNLDLRQSAAQVEAARQLVIVVGSKLKPQVSANLGGSTLRANNSVTSQDEQYASSNVYAAVSWELDVWGRLRSQRAAAQASYEAIALDYAFARQSLAATAAKSWYLAIETRQLLVLTEQSVKIYSDLLDLVKVRRAAGKVSDLDVAEASYQLSEAQTDLSVAQGLYSEARRTLEVLIGRYPAAELNVAEEFVPRPPTVGSGIPSSLLERRPDILAAEQSVLSAFRTQQAAKLALLPSFALTLEGGRLSDHILDVLHLNPWLFRSGLGMLVPVYQGGALRAEVKIATAKQEQSIAHFGSVALRALAEVEIALTNEGLLAERIPSMESAVRDHIEAVRVGKLRYAAGSMDFLSLLQLQEGEIASQADFIKMRNAQLANRINLHLALGGSFDSTSAASYR